MQFKLNCIQVTNFIFDESIAIPSIIVNTDDSNRIVAKQNMYSTVNGSGFLSLHSIGIQASGRKLTQQLEPNMVMQPILDDDHFQ